MEAAEVEATRLAQKTAEEAQQVEAATKAAVVEAARLAQLAAEGGLAS